MSFGTASMGVGVVEPAPDAPLVFSPATKPAPRGNGDQTADVMRFAMWMHGREREPTPEQVMERFEVSRSTAYRWLATWRGVQP